MTELLFERGVSAGTHHGYFYSRAEESVRSGWRQTQALATSARATGLYEVDWAEVQLFARTERKLYVKIVRTQRLPCGVRLDPLVKQMHRALLHLESKDHLQLVARHRAGYELKIEVVGPLAEFAAVKGRHKRTWA